LFTGTLIGFIACKCDVSNAWILVHCAYEELSPF